MVLGKTGKQSVKIGVVIKPVHFLVNLVPDVSKSKIEVGANTVGSLDIDNDGRYDKREKHRGQTQKQVVDDHFRADIQMDPPNN